MTEVSLRIMEVIRGIPPGRVMTYGSAATAAGLPRGARQVARLLHSASERHDLPWHRVVNSRRQISLEGPGGDLQRGLLESEGVVFSENRIPWTFFYSGSEQLDNP